MTKGQQLTPPTDIPILSVEQFRFFGTVIGKSPDRGDNPDYRAWYLSNRTNRERHIWREVLVALHGRCPFGWKNRIFTMDPGHVLFVEDLEPHACFYPPDMRDIVHLWYALPDQKQEVVASLVYDSGERLVTTSLPRVSMREDPYATFVSLWRQVSVSYKQGQELDRVRLEKLKAYTAAVVLESSSGFSAFMDEQQETPEQVVRTVQDLIETHPDNSLSLEKLAAFAGYSKYHFHRLFRDMTGETIHAYVTRKKIEHVWALLKIGYSCNAIAKEMGFGALSSFSRWFKDHTGVAPSQARLKSWP